MTAAVHYGREGEVAVLRVDNPPVNALSQAVRQGMADGLICWRSTMLRFATPTRPLEGSSPCFVSEDGSNALP